MLTNCQQVKYADWSKASKQFFFRRVSLNNETTTETCKNVFIMIIARIQSEYKSRKPQECAISLPEI